jgi:hypothetical protein
MVFAQSWIKISHKAAKSPGFLSLCLCAFV